MRQKGNEGRQNSQNKIMKVAKKQAGRPFEWTQGHQGGNCCETEGIGGIPGLVKRI
jgi:hypothetical protein